jgi:hypothetical protein
MVPIMREMRPAALPIEFRVLDSIWNWSFASPLEAEFKTRQDTLDPGSAHPDLFGIWNSRPSMLAAVARENPFSTRYFVSVDIGAQRKPELDFAPWPDEARMREFFSMWGDRPALSAVAPFNPNFDAHKMPARLMIQGGILAGSYAAVLWLNETYTRIFHRLLDADIFVGTDQSVLSALAAEEKSKLVVIEANGNRGNKCALNNWFYFWAFFGREGAAGCVRVPVYAHEAL